MKNFIYFVFLISVSAPGCYYTTIKKEKGTKTLVEDSVSRPSALSEAEFKHCYDACEQFYENILKRSHFSGEFLVAKKGEVIYEKYAGFARFQTKEPLNPASALHLASVSKTFTAMAVLKLWEEGKLDLNEEVSAYLSGFPYPGVTIKTLLNHRSGLPNYVHVMEQFGWNSRQIASNEDVLQFLISNKNKLFAGRPDRSFQYCNTNYALLALVIEKVSGLSYPQFMHDHFFEPLGMTDSYVFTMADSSTALPSFNARSQREAFTFLDAVYGDKNIYSTARDLLKWETALSYGGMFHPATLDSAYAGYSYEKKGIRNYGLGWRMLDYPGNEKIIYHNGWWHGNNTVFARILKDSATVIILGNKYNRNIYQARKLFPVFGDYATDDEGDE
ncbi:MAG: beta-lactamase family protein [Chitinophagaceae bacterium]|nr:beta-lactamase family protein [Chitinophagaceae bacterium]